MYFCLFLYLLCYIFNCCHHRTSHLVQVHLVGLLPGIQELPLLLFQWHHHHIITPETQHTLDFRLEMLHNKK